MAVELAGQNGISVSNAEIVISGTPFYNNTQNVTSNWTIGSGYNAMSIGPITINTGVTVTVGPGENWVIV